MPRLSALTLLACALFSGCERQSSSPAPVPQASSAGKPEPPKLATQPSPEPVPSAEPPPPPLPTAWSIHPSPPVDHTGPWFAVTTVGAGVYIEADFKSEKFGYLRGGSKVAVLGPAVSKEKCAGGWYALASGGFICGNYGTTNLKHPEVKFAPRQPDLEGVLPFLYARNSKHGTPLYRTVPSREQMQRYEPYLVEKKNAETPSPAAPDLREETTEKNALALLSPSALGAAGAAPGVPAEPEPEKPWWQQDNIKERLHEVKLEELEAEADELLAKRMVTGFYVAVDKRFNWNGRAWYKTTRGLITPTERFWRTSASDFKGLEIDETNVQLPVGWVYGGRKSTRTYHIDPETNKLSIAGKIDRFGSVQLAGEATELRGTTYEKLRDGTWIRSAHIRRTDPGPPPAGLAPMERWIDVNLKNQTLVAFAGDRPVFATLISSGKSSKIKDKDHSTPVGEWRIREKHLTTKMDGDGSAAGDLPYSIEEVPYAMYYHKAYALHGAFWHSNYGVQMSHGCVNLSPLDAKYLFFFAEPPIPAGFHGVWSTEANPGTRVVVHE